MHSYKRINRNIEEWINSQLEHYPGCNKEILSFIYRIGNYKGIQRINDDYTVDAIYNLFSNGYCFYFAKMLEMAFEGKAVWLYKRSHIVFQTPDKICYDIWGVFIDCVNSEIFPIEALTRTPLDGFMHIGNCDILVISSGDCSDTITWLLYENGILSICGKGKLPYYSKGTEPWSQYNHLIKI